LLLVKSKIVVVLLRLEYESHAGSLIALFDEIVSLARYQKMRPAMPHRIAGQAATRAQGHR
jgi:hypothetical protein